MIYLLDKLNEVKMIIVYKEIFIRILFLFYFVFFLRVNLKLGKFYWFKLLFLKYSFVWVNLRRVKLFVSEERRK